MIGGLPRAGTTAVVDLINECPDAAIMAEYRLIDLVMHLQPILEYETEIRDLEEALWPTDDAVAPETSDAGEAPVIEAPDLPDLIADDTCAAVMELDGADDDTLHYPGFMTPGLTETFRFPTRRRFPLIVSEVVKASLNKPAARIIGSKIPGSMLADGGDYLSKLFPDIRYLAMLRAPLAQINSSINRRNRTAAGIDAWNIEDVRHAIDTYINNILGLFVLRSRAKEALLFVKYEDLVHNYEEVADRLFSHLGTDWRPADKLIVAERGTINVLTPREKARVEQKLGTLIAGWDSAALTGTTDADLALFHDILPKVPSRHHSFQGDDKPAFLADGWSDIEPDGIWTCEERAALLFGPTPNSKMMLKIEFISFLASGEPLEVDVMMNDVVVERIILTPKKTRSPKGSERIFHIPDWTQKNEIVVGPLSFRNDDANLLEFRLNGIHSPFSLGINDDVRRLGIRLSGLELLPAS